MKFLKCGNFDKNDVKWIFKEKSMFKLASCLSVVPIHKYPKLSSSLKLDKTSLKLLLLSVYLFGHGGPVWKRPERVVHLPIQGLVG